ncbi:DUF4386 domain-containing protein [Robiginitalea biformata]|uniref:DUF4386 domain-containing protein n=1 Tax=Robiginitalea biformata (strain ATCC BAA-864 / DSM 15991 / KCTC 12146 / HTCC2501) TaxID=313596 RepID=A4CMD0_ROBBH|nr:DUF4386 domain-containing protein [Robiginitalea biformata]EAR14822.1 hypothetical protein RB2501_10867 [Robiginitalea biformata HTCC2501]
MFTLPENPKSIRIIGLIGWLYALIISCGLYAHFWVRASWIEVGRRFDFSGRIMIEEGPLRVSLAADLLMVLCDIVVAYLLFVLFISINRDIAKLAAIFRLVQSVILVVGIIWLLQLLLPSGSAANALDPLNISERQNQMRSVLQIHDYIYLIGGIFFGISLTLLGRLFLDAVFVPDILALLTILAGLSYMVDGFIFLLFPEYTLITETMVTFAALIAESLFCLWFLFIWLLGTLRGRGRTLNLP